MMRARATCLLLLVAGCGDNLPADGFRGGSRLRAVFLSDGDGARQFETFHDPWYGVDCTFQGDPLRCLPEAETVREYLDDGCSEPVFGRGVNDSACAPLPTHFGVPFDDACSSGPSGFSRLWTRGERVTPELTYVLEDGSCEARWARTDYEYYAAEVELPLESFVTGQRQLSGGPHRLRDVVLAGDDGSEQPLRFFDDALGAECSIDERLGRCVPDLVPAPFFSNPSCTWPLATWKTDACSPLPAFVGWYTADGALEIFERGDPFVPVWEYTAAGGSCVARYPDASVEYFRKGDRVVDELASTDDVLTGTGRLRAYRQGGFHDRHLATACTATPTGSDRWHCLPDFGVTAIELFADPLCEQEATVFEWTPGSAKSTRGLVWRSGGDDGCEQHARVHEVGREIFPGDLYDRRLLSCQRLTWNRTEVQRYVVGDEVPLGEYVSLRRATD
jgi:hypothetical protein